jgi:hypothetical protein
LLRREDDDEEEDPRPRLLRLYPILNGFPAGERRRFCSAQDRGLRFVGVQQVGRAAYRRAGRLVGWWLSCSAGCAIAHE